jgi:hypothetical protein
MGSRPDSFVSTSQTAQKASKPRLSHLVKLIDWDRDCLNVLSNREVWNADQEGFAASSAPFARLQLAFGSSKR